MNAALAADLRKLAAQWRNEGRLDDAAELLRRVAEADLPGGPWTDLEAPPEQALSWYPVIAGLVALVAVCFVSL